MNNYQQYFKDISDSNGKKSTEMIETKIEEIFMKVFENNL